MADSKTPKKLSAVTKAAFDEAQANGLTVTMSSPWSDGQNWTNGGTIFDTFINNNLFPKVGTFLAQQDLGNRFNFLRKEANNMTTVNSEDYVIADSIPAGLRFDRGDMDMLKANYPKLITKLYPGADFMKLKFTLNDNDGIQNFQTVGDAVRYAEAVYRKKISDINQHEELMIKSMLIDYLTKKDKDGNYIVARPTDADGKLAEPVSMDDLVEKIYIALLNIQNNSWKYNEASTASGGAMNRYSTYTPLDKVLILTTDAVKAHLLDSRIANTFQVAGLDITDHVISFDDLGGSYRVTEDITLADDNTVTFMQNIGWYQTKKGDVIYKDTIIPFDVTDLKDFAGKLEEVKPESNLFAGIIDIDSIGYYSKTAGMIARPQYLGETDGMNYFIHFQSKRYVRPFFNKIAMEVVTK